MSNAQTLVTTNVVETPSGRISYASAGSGPVALNPERVRTLTLTNCDTHDNWPPEAFKPFVEMVKAGGLRDMLNAMLADKAIFRSPGALGPGYERPEIVADEDIESYLRPLVRTEQRTRDVQRFVEAFDNKHTRAIEPQLRELRAPTLIAWATDDIYGSPEFQWARALLGLSARSSRTSRSEPPA